MVGIISGLISMLGWGTSDFFAAKVSRKIGNILTFFWPQVFGLFIALIYFFLKFQTFSIINVLKFLPLLLLTGFLFTTATLAFFEGFIKGKISLVSPIASSYTWIIVLLSVKFFHEILKINQIIGIFLIIIGIPLLSTNLKELIKIKKLNILSGTKEGLIAMFGWGFALFLIIPATRNLGWFLPAFITRLFGLLFVAIYIILSKKTFKINFQPFLWSMLLLIGFLDTIAFFAYSFGVEGTYASIVAPIVASFPLITIIFARIFLKEKLVLNQVLGIVSVIAGLILISL